MQDKHVPMRRCIGCMTSFPKNDVLRIVSLDEKPFIDLLGRQNGRGAYLCKSIDCFDLAVKKKRLTYTLGVSMSAEEIEMFREEFAKSINDAEVN